MATPVDDTKSAEPTEELQTAEQYYGGYGGYGGYGHGHGHHHHGGYDYNFLFCAHAIKLII